MNLQVRSPVDELCCMTYFIALQKCMLQTIQSRTQARIYQDWSLGCATHVQAFPITAVLQQIAFRQPPPAVEHRRTVPPRPESRRSESHAKSEYTGIAPPPAFEALRSTYPA